jgi:hypothetical protein
VRLWVRETGKLKATLVGHSGTVRGCVFISDKLVASASFDRTVRVWDVASFACVNVLHGHGSSINACAVSPSGQMLASGSDDYSSILWESPLDPQSASLQLHGHTGGVNAVVFSPSDPILLSGSSDGTIRAWAVGSGHCLACFQHNRINALAISSDGLHLFSCALHYCDVWDLSGMMAAAGRADVGIPPMLLEENVDEDMAWHDTEVPSRIAHVETRNIVKGCAVTAHGRLALVCDDGAVHLYSLPPHLHAFMQVRQVILMLIMAQRRHRRVLPRLPAELWEHLFVSFIQNKKID